MVLKGHIFGWHNEVQGWLQRGSVLAEFNKQKINAFYQEYQSRLETLYKEKAALEAEYFVMEEIEGATRVKTLDGEPVLLEGKLMADFDKAWAELMNQQVAERLKLIRG